MIRNISYHLYFSFFFILVVFYTFRFSIFFSKSCQYFNSYYFLQFYSFFHLQFLFPSYRKHLILYDTLCLCLNNLDSTKIIFQQSSRFSSHFNYLCTVHFFVIFQFIQFSTLAELHSLNYYRVSYIFVQTIVRYLFNKNYGLI